MRPRAQFCSRRGNTIAASMRRHASEAQGRPDETEHGKPTGDAEMRQGWRGLCGNRTSRGEGGGGLLCKNAGPKRSRIAGPKRASIPSSYCNSLCCCPRRAENGPALRDQNGHVFCTWWIHFPGPPWFGFPVRGLVSGPPGFLRRPWQNVRLQVHIL
jgi:hypothetical protein